MQDSKMKQYDGEWTDEQVVGWDGNFRSDGALFLPVRNAMLSK
jgi:hypothetical protein